jgi:hypothetical protein
MFRSESLQQPGPCGSLHRLGQAQAKTVASILKHMQRSRAPGGLHCLK